MIADRAILIGPGTKVEMLHLHLSLQSRGDENVIQSLRVHVEAICIPFNLRDTGRHIRVDKTRLGDEGPHRLDKREFVEVSSDNYFRCDVLIEDAVDKVLCYC